MKCYINRYFIIKIKIAHNMKYKNHNNNNIIAEKYYIRDKNIDLI